MAGPYYRFVPCNGGSVVTATRPEGLRHWLEERADWPEGRYEIAEGESVLLLFDGQGHHWGDAVKSSEGTVELIPDRPAGTGDP